MSVVGKVGQRFCPIVEFTSAAAKDAKPQNSVIGGLKYRINKATALGIGLQIPVTDDREFANQVLVQTDLEW